MFITVFTGTSHLPYPEAKLINFAPSRSVSLTCMLILSSHLLLGLPSSLSFTSSTNNLYSLLFHHVIYSCYVPRHLILHDLMVLILFGEELRTSSLCGFLQTHTTSHILSAPPPLCEWRSFTPMQKHRQKYSFVCSNFYIFIDNWREDKRFWTEW
jgi:hypothetical protein